MSRHKPEQVLKDLRAKGYTDQEIAEMLEAARKLVEPRKKQDNAAPAD